MSVHQGVRWSFAELRERVGRVASGLLGLGFEPGDRIGIWSPNRAEWLVTQYAAAKAGLILITINPAYRPGELEYVLQRLAMPRHRARAVLQVQQLCRDAELARAGDRSGGLAAAERAPARAADGDPAN